MQSHQAVSLPSQSAMQNAGLNGNTRHRRQESDVAGSAIDENAILINELHLLATKIEQLSTANRRKDEFLAILSHELRSPLASIQHGIAVLRGRSGAEVTVQHGMHELIERQVRQIARLASGLLDVGRITSGHLLVERERLDLRGVLAKAIETLEPEFGRRSQVVVPMWAASAIWLLADASRLEQVFVNLLANASKYTDAGGQVSLLVSADDGHASCSDQRFGNRDCRGCVCPISLISTRRLTQPRRAPGRALASALRWCTRLCSYMVAL